MGRGSKFGDFVTGVIFGGAIGYVFALLNAPRTGEETRAMLEERSRELRERALETVNTTVDKTGKIVTEGRSKVNYTVEDTRNRLQERVSDLKDRGETVFTDVRSKVSNNLHSVADQVDPEAGATPGGSETA